MSVVGIKRTGIVVGLATLWAGTTASAHDFWIEPSTFQLEIEERVSVGLCLGDRFEGRSVARNASRIETFVAIGPAGQQPIVGRDGSDPAGIARLTAPGVYVLGYRSNHAFTEMPAPRFEEYLKEKGLEQIVALRKERGASHRKAREAYSRYAKALVRVGDATGGDGDRPIGFRFELVAESNPYEERSGNEHSFHLLFDGKPLAGALVTATRRGAADSKIHARTDAGGRARFFLREAGVWLIASVHMVEAPQSIAAEWESLWASLTYELPSREPIAALRPQSVRTPLCVGRVDEFASQL